MNGQFLGGRAITVSYALKKDSKTERHGSMAERMLAAANPKKAQPNTMFSTGPSLSSANATPIGRPNPTPTPSLPPGKNLFPKIYFVFACLLACLSLAYDQLNHLF